MPGALKNKLNVKLAEIKAHRQLVKFAMDSGRGAVGKLIAETQDIVANIDKIGSSIRGMLAAMNDNE